MAKMVISLVVEETEENLNRIANGLLKNYGRAIVSYNCSRMEEPKKGLKIPAFMLNSNYKKELKQC